jgi:hypothetical protein
VGAADRRGTAREQPWSNAQLAAAPSCSGDGNADGVVDEQDLADFSSFELAQGWGRSSVYDLNFDGITDGSDETIITDGMGMSCSSAPGG